MSIALYTEDFWYWYISVIQTLAFHKDWLFVIYSIPAVILVSWGPFSIARVLSDSRSFDDIKNRWRLALIAPALFFIVPSVTLDFYILFGSKVNIRTEWMPQSHIWAKIAFGSFLVGCYWGILKAAYAKAQKIAREKEERKRAALQSENLERNYLLQKQASLQNELARLRD